LIALVIDSRTVSTVDDLLEVYYQSRNSLPPLPCPVSYETIAEQLADGRVDFIASPNWAYVHDGGTWYLSEDSGLAEKLLLPAALLAYEDLASGKVVLAAIPDATETVQTRRIVWTATLKPEADAWIDLLQIEPEDSPLPGAGDDPVGFSIFENPPEGFTGVPEDYILMLGIENSEGQLQIGWYGMRGFSYQLQGCADLIVGAFQDMGSSCTGAYEEIVVDVPQTNSCYFFRAVTTALDEDEDGLPDCWEYLYFDDIHLYGVTDDPDLDGLANAQEMEERIQAARTPMAMVCGTILRSTTLLIR